MLSHDLDVSVHLHFVDHITRLSPQKGWEERRYQSDCRTKLHVHDICKKFTSKVGEKCFQMCLEGSKFTVIGLWD